MGERNVRLPRLEDVPRTHGMVARGAFAAARRAGVALEPLLARSNLTHAQLEDGRASLPARDQLRFLDVVAEALADDLFGFHLARELELRELGLLYYVMASSNTVLTALQRAVRYLSIVNEGMVQQCEAGRHLDLTLHYLGGRRHLDRHHTECWAALLVRVLRQLTGQHLAPLRVRFMHPRSTRPGEFTAYFGGAIEFGARSDDVRFARAVGDTPLLEADPFLHRLLVGYCEEALAHRRTARPSFRDQVENVVAPLLPHGPARAGDIARAMDLSDRTFARRLAAEGITFSKLLAQVRLDLANRYLSDPGTTVSQVAWLLGYQEASAFSRAYKRWTGQAPREVRASGRR